MVVTVFDVDDPEPNISTHVNLKGCTRDQDAQIDWKGEAMFGCLPYDRYGCPQLGSMFRRCSGCNTRCPCGANCLNREVVSRHLTSRDHVSNWRFI